jgi:DNA-binding NtrC family response regulator
MTKKVLVSWLAVNNDPFEFDRNSNTYKEVNGEQITGPTLTLLEGQHSPFKGQIKDVVIFHRKQAREERAMKDLQAELKKLKIRSEIRVWSGSDPTDHKAIFEFLRKELPIVRKTYSDSELVIHVSPGTPSMHTIWVLMAETGFIEQPYQVVKSYRDSERNGRPSAVPAEVGIDTFYKAFKQSRPRQSGSDDQRVAWDPGEFRSEKMRSLYAEARRFARVNVPILIRGERGTGKTTLAGWIRSNSPFRVEKLDEGWPSVACGQYSPETMRSELFGHKKGAFTGATENKVGLLEIANKDTLFLDEIGDVSRDLQRLLIKAIEEKTFSALGDEKPRRSDFRLITATNISDEVLRERLDPDFYDRISALNLTLPPLREVPEELEWLWPMVFQQAKKRAGVKMSHKLPAALEKKLIGRLRDHTLPGNIRDLFRIAYRIAALLNEDETATEEIIEYGLLGLQVETKGGNLAKEIAGCFASSLPLDGVFQRKGQIPTGQVLGEFQGFLAKELMRLAKEHNQKHEDISDVSRRTLSNWLKDME